MVIIISSLKEAGSIWEVKVNRRRTYHPVTKELFLKEMMLDIVELYLDGQMDVETNTHLKKKIQKLMF